jgi:hypothetical protein
VKYRKTNYNNSKFDNLTMLEERRNRGEIIKGRTVTKTLDGALAGPRGEQWQEGAQQETHGEREGAH